MISHPPQHLRLEQVAPGTRVAVEVAMVAPVQAGGDQWHHPPSARCQGPHPYPHQLTEASIEMAMRDTARAAPGAETARRRGKIAMTTMMMTMPVMTVAVTLGEQSPLPVPAETMQKRRHERRRKPLLQLLSWLQRQPLSAVWLSRLALDSRCTLVVCLACASVPMHATWLWRVRMDASSCWECPLQQSE